MRCRRRSKPSDVARQVHDGHVHRTVITLDVPVEHRYAVGDLVWRQEQHIAGPWSEDDERSVWRIIEVGYSLGTGPWYRLVPVNEMARFKAMSAYARTTRKPTPLIEAMTGPVTERVSTVDRQCQPYEAE